uniref:Uncharacterized protein n=1 Tax=Romanomermis culicivorax TaxID=13658 RepID=A0A915I206_ROMCU
MSHFYFTLLFLNVVYCDPNESKLIADLLKNYNDLERPVREPELPVKVKLGFQLIQIVDLDEKNQTLDTIAYLLYSWNDYNLKWDPKEYGNVTSINLPIDKIWRPDVLLYNSGSTDFDSTFKSMAQIDQNGSIFWNPPAIMKSTCDIDVRYFPFDEQLCWLKFGSWTYNGLKLDLEVDESGLDTSMFIPNGEWLLQDVNCNRSTKFYTCCPNEPYYDVKFYLHLRRRTLSIGMNIIVPSLLISVLASFTFVLPVDAGEKVALETTVMMSLIYCLEIVAEMTPVTSDSLPLLSMFYMSCIILIGISCVFAVLVIISHTANPDTQIHMHTTVMSFSV